MSGAVRLRPCRFRNEYVYTSGPSDIADERVLRRSSWAYSRNLVRGCEPRHFPVDCRWAFHSGPVNITWATARESKPARIAGDNTCLPLSARKAGDPERVMM